MTSEMSDVYHFAPRRACKDELLAKIRYLQTSDQWTFISLTLEALARSRNLGVGFLVIDGDEGHEVVAGYGVPHEVYIFEEEIFARTVVFREFDEQQLRFIKELAPKNFPELKYLISIPVKFKGETIGSICLGDNEVTSYASVDQILAMYTTATLIERTIDTLLNIISVRDALQLF
jgi:hypothetical protein